MTMSVAPFRKLTPAMLASQRLAMANDIVKTTKSEVAMALKKAAPALGIDGTTYHILDILIGLTAAEDWQQSRRPLVAISNEKLAEYVSRSKRTVVRSLRRLVEAGVLAYKDSPTGRRYIYRRGEERVIEHGYGLDFSPARQQLKKLKRIGNEFAERLKHEKDARRTNSQLRRALEDLRLLAKQEGVDFEEIARVHNQIEQQGYDLLEKAEALTLLHEQALILFEGQSEEVNLADDETSRLSSRIVHSEQMTTTGVIDVTPYNNTTHQDSNLSKNRRRSSKDDHSKSPSLAKGSTKMALEKNGLSKFGAKTPVSDGFTSALSEVSLGLLQSATREAQETLEFELSSWGALELVCRKMRLLVGLSEAGWEDARAKVGPYLAGAVLITTVEKTLRVPQSISRPAGYFRACIDRAIDGKLMLHKTLFGLNNVGLDA
ncbi:plasmid replication protein RepC [Pseudovibrio sp. Ad37]|uniref:plasmid replication protein RepC n=1 Tax=Pseudovibrio sp. Ad37 TaxID=989422 RepID=UPI0007AE6C12|nr:plasmid replication protein RepC [Pseudovibrio sp. Ad37]KZL24231.1 hypothetical protein PsAD37_02802 [Pseudovibrio sp. Ad37]